MINKICFALIACFLGAGQLVAASVNFESFSTRTFTDIEKGNALSLHMRVCGIGVSVDGNNVTGSQCARLKLRKKPGKLTQHSIIFESNAFSVFPLITNDKDGKYYKFWLRERQMDDTQNFSLFLKTAPSKGTAVIGALCKRLSDETFFNKIVGEAYERAAASGRLDERVVRAVEQEGGRSGKAIRSIANRCFKTAEKHIGNIVVTTGTFYAPTPSQANICGFTLADRKSRSELMSIQRGLSKRNLYNGGIDGKFGKGSCSALDKWAKCENIGSKKLSDGSLAKLIKTNPSARELSCYGSTPTPTKEPKGSSSTLKVFTGSSCTTGQSNFQIRLNQTALKGLGLYTSTVDGILGPNYRKAVAGGEKLLGQWADEQKDCLGVSERKILEAVVAARKRGSTCEYLSNSTEIRNRFTSLKSAGVVDKSRIDHEKPSGLIWMIDTVSNEEMKLKLKNFYSVSKSSIRNCRLDSEELKALRPQPAESPVSSKILAESVSMTAVTAAESATLSLVIEGSDLETSMMSKSVFGLNNQVQMDIKFDMSGGSPSLDLIVSESETKINLHFYDNEAQSDAFAAGLKELTLGKTLSDQSAFRIRMLDSGKSNIDNGDFRKLLSKMPSKDHAMISALCGNVAGISTSSEGFEAQFSKPEHKASFRSSLFSNPQVRSAVNKLATQCVSEVRSTVGVEASFKISAQPIACTATENEGLASIDAQIASEQTSLLSVQDEINQLQSQRPLFQFKECAAYADNAIGAAKRLESLQQEVVRSNLEADSTNANFDAGRALATRIADLKIPADICLVENKALREDVNKFVFDSDPVFVGIQCPGADDAQKNPVQIVIDEINAEILKLLEVHISQDEIAALEAERDNTLQEFRDLAARLAVIEQSKASPDQVREQTDTNASLRQSIDDIEVRILALENEIRDLNGILANNSGLIEDIDALNQRLVELSAQQDSRQITLEEVKSKALGAQAMISQRDLEISKLEGQISNLEIQMEAASSTAGTLVDEVVQLGQDIANTTQRVTTLEANVSEAQAFIDSANGAIGQKSQEVSKLDADLSKKVAEATILSNSVTTLAPQADAAETTVEGMRASLKTDYVPMAQFQEKATRLNELTQAVTERTKLIQELRLDLGSIEQEEQLLIKMCIADAQCKAAMGERLGVDQ